MSKRLYNYKITYMLEPTGFNSRGTKLVSAVSYVYNVPSIGIATRLFKLTRMKQLRKNGLRAPVSTPHKIERVTLSGKVR